MFSGTLLKDKLKFPLKTEYVSSQRVEFSMNLSFPKMNT